MFAKIGRRGHAESMQLSSKSLFSYSNHANKNDYFHAPSSICFWKNMNLMTVSHFKGSPSGNFDWILTDMLKTQLKFTSAFLQRWSNKTHQKCETLSQITACVAKTATRNQTNAKRNADDRACLTYHVLGDSFTLLSHRPLHIFPKCVQQYLVWRSFNQSEPFESVQLSAKSQGCVSNDPK